MSGEQDRTIVSYKRPRNNDIVVEVCVATNGDI